MEEELKKSPLRLIGGQRQTYPPTEDDETQNWWK